MFRQLGNNYNVTVLATNLDALITRDSSTFAMSLEQEMNI
jgi:hypothetical protein